MDVAREGIDTGGRFADVALRGVSFELQILQEISTFLYVTFNPLYGDTFGWR